MAALQASGIGVVGPENAVDAKPLEPWQGITMQRWEVRLAAAMVLPQRGVSLALPDLAAFLVAAIPELTGAPVEQLIVKDLRALADSPAPTKQFFGRFIGALGRNAVSHAPYDLSGDVNPQTIQLDGLQTSLLLRRLAIDVLMLTGDAKGQSAEPPKKTGLVPRGRSTSGWCRRPTRKAKHRAVSANAGRPSSTSSGLAVHSPGVASRSVSWAWLDSWSGWA